MWRVHCLSLFLFPLISHGSPYRLLIVLRLWRVVKVIEAAVMSTSIANQEQLESLQDELAEVKQAYAELEKAYDRERLLNRPSEA